MNNLTSRQRKTAWFVAILVLLIPVVLLGMPAGNAANDSGGVLSDLRAEHDLGESKLGQIDPTSATMNLLLLGLRGVAVNVLRMDLDDYKNRKDWAQMQATTEAVITLQPHYIEVWRFLGWNLSYNVSAEWDAVPERYYWVKEGGKFLQRGEKRNNRVPELKWEAGRTWGHKVGRSDEWKQFRRFFVSDPDTKRFKGEGDPEINPNGTTDNYLVAKDWFVRANIAERNHEQHIMMRELFRSYPSKSQIEYADALQREGKFEGVTVAAWQQAYEDWTTKFGKEEIHTFNDCKIYMEANEDDVRQMAIDSGVAESVILGELVFYQNVANYLHWRLLCLAEKEEGMGLAHRLLYDGEQLYNQAEHEKARAMLLEGLQRFESILSKDQFSSLRSEDNLIEEIMWGTMLWRQTYLILRLPVPATFPLKDIWDKHQNKLPTLQSRFNHL
jgi:hypothetical protein